MKHIGLAVSVVTASVLSCGCASIPFVSKPDPGVDVARVAQVERMASGRGVGIYWVNPPTRRAMADDVAVPGGT